MALLVFVIAGEEWGCSSRGTGEIERDEHSSPPRWLLNQKLTGGFGGLEPHRKHASWKARVIDPPRPKEAGGS